VTWDEIVRIFGENARKVTDVLLKTIAGMA
jgi:hypothetical protein